MVECKADARRSHALETARARWRAGRRAGIASARNAQTAAGQLVRRGEPLAELLGGHGERPITFAASTPVHSRVPLPGAPRDVEGPAAG
jgi:hypothetical protein